MRRWGGRTLANREAAARSQAAEAPEVVVSRLPIYLRALRQLLGDGSEVASSQSLGRRLHMTPAQIRKDLGYFGRFGKQGRGYDIRNLISELEHILGLNQEWPVALVGVGRLGRAILGYPGFNPEGFTIRAAFDNSPSVVGQNLGGIEVRSTRDMAVTLRSEGIRIAVVAVPAAQTQSVIDQLVSAGVQAILNYSPTSPQAPREVKVRNVDPVMSLQSMTYFLRAAQDPGQ